MSEIVEKITETTHVFTECEIIQYLDIYKPTHVHVTAAEYCLGELVATFRRWQPELYRNPLKHLSRVQIVHYVGQAGYLLGAYAAREGKLFPIDERGYMDRVREEKATFRKLSLSFKQYIPNAADGTTIRMRYGSVRRTGAILLATIQFDLNSGACIGTAEAVIAI